MPQVYAVGAHPEPAQRGHQRRSQPAGGMGKGGHDPDRTHRQQHVPAEVEKRRVLARTPDQERNDGQPGDPRPVQKQATPDGEVRAKVAARPHHGQGGAYEEARGAGVGSFVDSRGIDPRLVKQRHNDGREGCSCQGNAGKPVAPTGVTQAEPEQERPDQVKLLLNRQGPQVVERWRRPEAREVGGVDYDVPPVAHVDGGSGYVPQAPAAGIGRRA